MNRILRISPLGRELHGQNTSPAWFDLARRVLVVAFVALCASGCGNRDSVRVKLQARPASKEYPGHLDVQAQVVGPVAGLRYKWFSVNGGCDPQESEVPSTVFKFAEGALRDRILVEIWRGASRIAQSEINVKYNGEPGRLEDSHEVHIEITSVPPYEQGGPDTHAAIAGKVSGKISSNYAIVIYARAYDNWFIQPTAQAQLPIHPDNTWTGWTHTGTSYAALVVRPGFDPLPRLDLLPQIGGPVLARAIVEGRR